MLSTTHQLVTLKIISYLSYHCLQFYVFAFYINLNVGNIISFIFHSYYFSPIISCSFTYFCTFFVHLFNFVVTYLMSFKYLGVSNSVTFLPICCFFLIKVKKEEYAIHFSNLFSFTSFR